MLELLEGQDGMAVLMDDILIYGSTVKEHDQRLNAVMEKIENSGLKLNKEKMCLP